MIKVYTDNELRKTEVQPQDEGFDVAVNMFHGLTGSQFKSSVFHGVCTDDSSNIVTAYVDDCDTKGFDKGDFIIAIKFNTLTKELFFKSYKRGNPTNIGQDSLSTLGGDFVAPMIATGFFSNDINKVTFYFSNLDPNIDNYERMTVVADFFSVTVIIGADLDYKKSEYIHVFS